MKDKFSRSLLSGIVATAFPVCGVSFAQDNTEVRVLEELVVTARKRAESIIDVPLSIQAFSREDLRAAGIGDLEGLAGFTPNLDFQSLGNSQPGRYNSVIRFRGMDLAVTTPTNQSGGFFVDGINVLGGASSVSYSDIASVEVIRGPQPVYFGRGTFGGAINYTTVTPGDEFAGEVAARYSPTFGSNDFHLWVEGGLADNLTARATIFSRTVGAPFNANDGGKLGDENTSGGSLIFDFDPVEELRLKARIAYSEDDDRAPSSTFVPYRTFGNIRPGDTIELNTEAGPETATFTQAFHRGSVPTNVDISSNTTFYPFSRGDETGLDMKEFLAEALIEGAPDVDGIGLRTNMMVASLAGDYDLNDAITASALFGYNERETVQVRDADQTDARVWVTKTFLILNSYSAELRLNYDDGGKLRLLGGLSYAEMEQEGDVDGGFSIFEGAFGVGIYGYSSSSLDVAYIDTLGIFGAVEYDVLDNLTVALEGRYQDEKIVSRGGLTMATLTTAREQEYDEFLPRLSVTWNPLEDASVFLSYSEAALPGSRNTSLDRLAPESLAAFFEQYPDILLETDPETLEAYELGWKQTMFNGALWYSVVGFIQEWDNMKASTLLIFDDPVTGRQTFLNPTVPGSSTQKGIELEARWSATHNLQINTAYGYVESEYDDYVTGRLAFAPTSSAFQAAGNTLPRSPKHSAALGVTWTDELVEGWDYSIRGDLLYRGKSYTDETNLAWIDAYSLFNLRLGVQNQNDLTLEVYCNNCFDEDGWATGRRLTDFSENPAFFRNQGAVVDPIVPREIGVGVSFAF